MSKTEANDTFHYWLEILGNILPASLLDSWEKQDNDYEMVLELLTEFELIVDSMEQPRLRPSEPTEQQQYFSGKKKQHTFKSQFIILPKGKDIVDVKIGQRGPVSDISLLRNQQTKFADIQKFQGRLCIRWR